MQGIPRDVSLKSDIFFQYKNTFLIPYFLFLISPCFLPISAVLPSANPEAASVFLREFPRKTRSNPEGFPKKVRQIPKELSHFPKNSRRPPPFWGYFTMGSNCFLFPMNLLSMG